MRMLPFLLKMSVSGNPPLNRHTTCVFERKVRGKKHMKFEIFSLQFKFRESAPWSISREKNFREYG